MSVKAQRRGDKVLARAADEACAVAVVRQERRAISDECARLYEENEALTARVVYLEKRLRYAVVCAAIARGSRERLEARCREQEAASQTVIEILTRLAFPNDNPKDDPKDEPS